MVRPVIHSVKHIISLTPTTAAAAAIANVNFATAVVSPDADNSVEVVEGAVIKAIYVEFWFTSDDTTFGSTNAFFEKRPSGAATMTFANAQAMFSYPNKNNVMLSAQGLLSTVGGTPMALMRGWIKIPKGKQRMALGDIWTMNWTGLTNGTTVCGLVIYKEYR